MEWGSFSNFLHMGGYGLYVWGSYAVTVLVLALEVFLLVRDARTQGKIAGRSVQERSGTKE